jgi:uncharacterized repeat protein (TIGR03803 family)
MPTLNRMKSFTHLLITVVLLAELKLAPAQTLTNLYVFGAAVPVYTNKYGILFYTNSAGIRPVGGLVLSNNTLYGTASAGGSSGVGTVFRVNTDGTGFTNLHSFTKTSYPDRDYESGPRAQLVLSGDTLYGTTADGGSANNGTVFKINTDGTGFTNLYSFKGLGSSTSTPYDTNSDGATPDAGLILSSNILYGTAMYGGSFGAGTVFKVNIDGTGFTNLHSFYNVPDDGAYPRASLALLGNTLYGTTFGGGSSGNGTVFKINTDGTGYTNLYNCIPGIYGGGISPEAGLVVLGNTLYGTMSMGGSANNGTVFKINTDGTGFTPIFSSYSGDFGGSRSLNTGVILSGINLYGCSYSGGYSGYSKVFRIHTDGTGYTELGTLHSDKSLSKAGLISSGNILYGTVYGDSYAVAGRVFRLSLPPPPHLTVVHSTTSVIITWPTNAAGFILQSTTNLALVVWNTNLFLPTIINGQNTVTNSIGGTQQFFRLIAN